jgi:hypothetical protein
MGLDTTHNAWHGPYSSFNQWRHWLAEQIGIPLEIMEGFYLNDDKLYPNLFMLLEYKFPAGDELEMAEVRRLKNKLPLKWNVLKPDPLHKLLYHSDCDGYINWVDCGKIAVRLNEILLQISNDNAESRSPLTERANYDGMYNATKRFMKGCELAFKNKEKLLFG